VVGIINDFSEDTWLDELKKIVSPRGLRNWHLAVVLGMTTQHARIGLKDGTQGKIPLNEILWAKEDLGKGKVGVKPAKPSDVLAVADVIIVKSVKKSNAGKFYPEGSYALEQIPEIGGGLVALDPHTGRVLAMTGGYDFSKSEFNRATQAMRQPGSSFKPFVYLTAFENGWTPSSIVLDAPVVFDQGEDKPKWRPDNYSQRFYGETTLRTGVEHSRNLMTIRLAQDVGMGKIARTAKRFGISDNLPRVLAASIGSSETTLIRLAAAYGMLVNGGRKIKPTFIDRIQDEKGQSIFKHDLRACNGCQDVEWIGQSVPALPDTRKVLTDPISAYQTVHVMQGVVERGTGIRAKIPGKVIAGKTGTTNKSIDTWFVGFTPDLVVGVYVGYDTPKPMGRRETGGSTAAPIFKQFMQRALRGKEAIPFRVPSDVEFVRVNRLKGLRTEPSDKMAVMEAFKPGTAPTKWLNDDADDADLLSEGIEEGVEPSAGGSSSSVDEGLY
ncbi:MAG: penicillin-binding protein 1A, partial [Alphaproteobacteria bacterium]